MYLIFLENRAKKELKKLDSRHKIKISDFIDKLQFDPFLGKKMSGEYNGSYRIKIPPLRIIYFPDFKNKIIWIRAIGFRGNIYK
jgi:mRNA-degrading endonuclease RelE of RelBE toxin-antitoxin system